MAVLFSKVNLAADNGAKTVFLCCGIPDGGKSLEGYTAPSVSEYGHSNFMINVDEINGRICGVELEM